MRDRPEPGPTASLTRAQVSARSSYERTIDRYLKECFRTRTAVRASAISRLVEANRTQVSELIGRLFGKPLKAVLREKQLAHAVKLLELTAHTVSEIAVAAGFGDETTFHRAFKKAYGIKPLRYRRKSRTVR